MSSLEVAILAMAVCNTTAIAFGLLGGFTQTRIPAEFAVAKAFYRSIVLLDLPRATVGRRHGGGHAGTRRPQRVEQSDGPARPPTGHPP